MIVPPIRGFFLLGGGSYFISPIANPFFLAVTRNSAPNVSPPLKLNFEIVFFLYALKFEKGSVMPIILPSVLEAIFSEILGSFVREATTMSNSSIFCISLGMCSGSFSKSASIVIITGYLASFIP